MIKIIKKITYEPLLHFLIIGIVLYAYFNSVNDSDELLTPKMEVSSYETQKIKSEFKKDYSYDINPEQLKAFKAKKIYEKIVLKEAYALGLDKQDAEIENILLKQMNFIMINESKIIEPSEEALLKYYKKNIVDYSKVETLSFSHVYFSNAKDTKVDETLHLLEVANVRPEKAVYFGNMFKPSNNIVNANYKEVQELYGKYFTRKLFNLKKDIWHKGIHSKYGLHLVYVTDKKVSDAEEFDEVQDRVYLDYMSEQLRDKFNSSYENLKSQYSITSEI